MLTKAVATATASAISNQQSAISKCKVIFMLQKDFYNKMIFSTQPQDSKQ
jgi:hypothetical protein